MFELCNHLDYLWTPPSELLVSCVLPEQPLGVIQRAVRTQTSHRSPGNTKKQEASASAPSHNLRSRRKHQAELSVGILQAAPGRVWETCQRSCVHSSFFEPLLCLAWLIFGQGSFPQAVSLSSPELCFLCVQPGTRMESRLILA